MFLSREAATQSSSSAVISEVEAAADTTESMGGAEAGAGTTTKALGGADGMTGEALGGFDEEEDVPVEGSDTTTDAATGRVTVRGTEAEAQ